MQVKRFFEKGEIMFKINKISRATEVLQATEHGRTSTVSFDRRLKDIILQLLHVRLPHLFIACF